VSEEDAGDLDFDEWQRSFLAINAPGYNFDLWGEEMASSHSRLGIAPYKTVAAENLDITIIPDQPELTSIFTCPVCKQDQEELQHGTVTDCVNPYCSTKFVCWGNLLRIGVRI
jgi:hypothetical protein